MQEIDAISLKLLDIITQTLLSQKLNFIKCTIKILCTCQWFPPVRGGGGGELGIPRGFDIFS